MECTFIKMGRPGYLEPFVATTRGVVVKGYRVSGWRHVVASWLVSREDRAQSDMSRIGIAPLPIASKGLVEERHVGFAMARLSGVHPSGPLSPEMEVLLVESLDRVHRAGWTHNDIHASNVLIDDGETKQVWLLDWATATKSVWLISGFLRSRDRRHLKKIIDRAQGRPYERPLLSRIWKSLQSWRR